MPIDTRPEPPRRGGRLFAQIPMSEAERIAVHHRAIDARMSMGEYLRHALGLPRRPPPAERRAPM